MPGERRSRAGLIAPAILILDGLTKLAVRNFFAHGESLPVIRGVFHLTLIRNTGGAFGILKDNNFFFIILGSVAVAAILINFKRIILRPLIVRVSFALILGGVIGNLIDRIRFGYVVDFLDFKIWPVFNIADSAITLGAALLCIILFKSKRKAQNAKP